MTENLKIELCHWANGNPHTIEVSVNAADTHLIWHTATGWNPAPGHEQDTIGVCPPPSTATTSTTAPPASTTTTTTSPAVPATSTSTTTTTETATGTSASGTRCMTRDGFPYVTSYPVCPTATVTTAPATTPIALTELAQTGASSLDLAAVGLALVIAGTFLRRRGRHV